MISFTRWTTRRRSNITNKSRQELNKTDTRCQWVPSYVPRKRNHKKCRWSALTAFDWLAYTNRNQSLRLLRRMKVHVDTTLTTRDGFHETVHWQVISALCPILLEHSSVVMSNQSFDTRPYYTVEFPEGITSPIADLIVECAYGEPRIALDKASLHEFYKVAIKYDIRHAINICLDYARTILNIQNCIYLLQLGIFHKHQKLRRAAYAMIRANFKLILHLNNDFHFLQAKQLRQLLLDDALRINEDEEIAWLAIVRWYSALDLTRTQSELARIYNQMVSEPQKVLRRTNTWPPPNSTHQQPMDPHEQHQSQHSGLTNQQQQQWQLVRLTLDFYSPIEAPTSPNVACSQRTKPSHATDKDKPWSPLRAAAEAHLSSPKADSTSSQKVEDEEDELYCLIKCLRFMRFRSLCAFEVILSYDRVSRSARLTHLVRYMRLRYKLRHKIGLTDEDKDLVTREDLRKLKNSETNRTQRIVNSVSKLIALSLRAPSQHAVWRYPSSTVGTSSREDPEQQHQMVSSSSTATARAALTPDLMHNQFSVRSLERAIRPRIPNSVGLLIGGWQDGSVTNSIWAYDFIYDSWFKLKIKLPEPRALHASCGSPRGQVYILGGTDGKAILNSVLRIHPASDVFISSSSSLCGQVGKTKHKFASKKDIRTLRTQARLVYKFKQLCPMSERRFHLSAIFHSNGRLYALGGHNGTQRLRSGEWYDTQSNQWHPIADMTIARANAAACSHDNKIFIAGGQISDSLIQSSVEFYKSSDNTWTFAAPMIIPRMAFSLVSHRGHLLAMGGTNGLMGGGEVVSVTRSVECYIHNSGVWAFCAPMLQKRCAFGVMQIENRLLIMGGHGGKRRLRTCESLKIGNFTSQAFGSSPSSAMLNQLQINQRPDGFSGPDETNTTSDGTNMIVVRGKSVLSNTQRHELHHHQPVRRGSATTVQSLRDLATLAGSQQDADEPMRAANRGEMPMSIRSAMKWIPKTNLPEKRSGFSIAVVHKLKNAKDFTYFGSIKTTARGGGTCTNSNNNSAQTAAKPSFIKQPGRWHKFKIIKRRKLVKHLKIALILTAVILLM